MKKPTRLLFFVWCFAVFGGGYINAQSVNNQYSSLFMFPNPNNLSSNDFNDRANYDAWQKTPNQFIPNNKRLITSVESIELSSSGSGRNDTQGGRLYDEWAKQQLNIIYRQDANTWKTNAELGGIEFSARYKGPVFPDLKKISITNGKTSTTGTIRMEMENGVYYYKDIEKIVLKAAADIVQSNNLATITLDPFFENGEIKRQRFITTGVTITSSAAYILGQADLLLKSIDFGYDHIQNKDMFAVYRGFLGSKYFDNIYAENTDPSLWNRSAIVLQGDCIIQAVNGEVIVILPPISIDIGLQQVINGKFVEIKNITIPKQFAENKNILEQNFRYLSEKKDFEPWDRLLRMAETSILFDMIKRTNQEEYTKIDDFCQSIPGKRIDEIMEIKKSFNIIRNENNMYFQYLKNDRSFSGKMGGVEYSLRPEVQYSKTNFIKSVYDYLEKMTFMQLPDCKITKIIYDPLIDRPAMIFDSLGNKIFLSYDNMGLKYIGLSNIQYQNYFTLEFTGTERDVNNFTIRYVSR